MGARALFAFRVGERGPDGEPTDDAEVGSLMEYERWVWDIALARGFYDVFSSNK